MRNARRKRALAEPGGRQQKQGVSARPVEEQERQQRYAAQAVGVDSDPTKFQNETQGSSARLAILQPCLGLVDSHAPILWLPR